MTSSESLIREDIIRLRTSLFLFYRLFHEENPAENFSTLGDLSEKTLGQRSGSCKCAETRMLLPFSIWLFKRHPGVVPQDGSSWLQTQRLVTQLSLAEPSANSPVDCPSAPTQLILSTTRGHGAFFGTTLKDVARTPRTAASILQTRNLWELAGIASPLSAVLSVMIGSSTLVSTCCCHPSCRPIELPKGAPDCKTPLGPGHAVGSPTQIDVTAEHRECSNLFRIDTSWTCVHHLLRDLSSLTSKTFHNQRSLRLSQTDLQRTQSRFHELTQAPRP